MRRVKEASLLVGVSRRTLQYYDDEGMLLTPRSKENYRLYDDATLERVWDIMLYRELNFSLKEVNEILTLPPKERKRFIEEQIERLESMKEDLEREINFATAIKNYGLPPVCLAENSKMKITYSECICALKEALGKVPNSSNRDFAAAKKEKENVFQEVEFSDDFAEWMQQNCAPETVTEIKNSLSKYLRREIQERSG